MRVRNKVILLSKIISALIFITLLITFAASQLIITSGGGGGNQESSENGGRGFSLQMQQPPISLVETVVVEDDPVKSDLLLDISPNCSYQPADFKAMGDSVERALAFFESNVDKLVLDAAVGTRVVEAQLKLALDQHPTLPQLLQQYLKYLIAKANALSDKIIRAIVVNPKISLVEKEHTLPWVTTSGLWDWPIDGRWESVSIMKSYESKLKINATEILSQSRETIEEDQSDACIFQVFNCHTEKISDDCRKLFFVKEQSLYSLTHQVIYTLFAKKRDCFQGVNSNGLRRYQEKLCGKVWLEANAISETGFPPNYQDLFVEQIGICGMTGYPNFFRRDWLKTLLSWQSGRKSGCFLDQRVHQAHSIAMLVKLYAENQQKFHELISSSNGFATGNNNNKKITSRQKRSDAFLKQGNYESCSVHFTSVGITAISTQMRYFIDTCLSSY